MSITKMVIPNWAMHPTATDWQKELAKRHKLVRKQQGFSQQALATRSGVSLGSLKRFEATGQIALESLLMLMHLLNRLQDLETVLAPQEDMKEIEKLFTNKNK